MSQCTMCCLPGTAFQNANECVVQHAQWKEQSLNKQQVMVLPANISFSRPSLKAQTFFFFFTEISSHFYSVLSSAFLPSESSKIQRKISPLFLHFFLYVHLSVKVKLSFIFIFNAEIKCPYLHRLPFWIFIPFILRVKLKENKVFKKKSPGPRKNDMSTKFRTVEYWNIGRYFDEMEVYLGRKNTDM
jgi:hypothetical protein